MTSYSDLGKKFTNEIIEPISEASIARELMYVNTSITNMSLDSIQAFKFSELSDATIMRALPDGSIFRDGLRSETHTVLINSIVEGFDIKKQEFDNYMNNGIAIDSSIAKLAGEKVAERENEMAIVGWKPDDGTFMTEGMLNLTNSSSDATSYDFGTYGNAIKKVVSAKNTLLTAGVQAKAYNLSLNPTQYSELEGSESTTGIMELEQVMKRLNPIGGRAGTIRPSSDVSANYGLLTPVDPIGKYFEMNQTWAPNAEITTDPIAGETSPIYGKVFERVGLNFKYPAAICKLSGI